MSAGGGTMRRRRRSFIWTFIIVELSLIVGAGTYVLINRDSQAYDSELAQLMEVEAAKANSTPPSLSQKENTVVKSQVSAQPTNAGGPYIDAPPLYVTTYRAKNGDNLWSIAKENNLDFFTILSINHLKSSNDITVGQKLKIPNQCGIIHTVRRGETLEDIALAYNVNLRKIIRANQILDPSQIKYKTELFIPDAKVTVAFTRELLEKSGVIKIVSNNNDNEDDDRGKAGRVSTIRTQLALPCTQSKITSGFGYRRDPFTGHRAFHAGSDYSPGYGSNVYAAMDGVVTYAGWMGGYGKLVVVTHNNGYSTRYGHLSRINVKVGSHVNQGQRIGSVGNTGRSTGPHLHFEVRKDDKPLNARKIVKN